MQANRFIHVPGYSGTQNKPEFGQKKCKKFLEELISKRFLFPDALVLEEDNKFYHSYVEQLINKSGIKPNYLSKKQIKHS